MIRNHLKIALRNLWRHRTQTFILVGGLSIGMTACLLLLQYVSFELSFDDFHQQKDNIYRVVNERIQEGKTVQKGTITYPTIGPKMLEEFPEVVNATRIAYSSNMMLSKDDKVDPIEPGLWVDEHFLEIFDFEIIAQQDLNLLDAPNELVLTKSIVDRYFPAAKGNYAAVIGEEVRIDTDDDAYTIVGVIADVPANSTLQFDLLGSYASFIKYMGEGADNSWTWSDFYHYVQLDSKADVAALEDKLVDFSERHFRGTEVSGSKEVFTLQALKDAHLYAADLEYEIGTTSSGKAVWSLLLIAFLILLLAWINYINLSSVRAIERAKEVGVRKVVGATRWQLVKQFFTEAVVINMVSLGIGIALAVAVMPWFATQFGLSDFGLQLMSANSASLLLLLTLLGLLIVSVVISGTYPAFLLSSPQVSSVLKGVFAKDTGGTALRKGLVVFQFTISTALIIGTWFVSRQVAYINQQDIGVQVDQMMILNAPELSSFDSTFISRMDAFKAALTQVSGVQEAATSSRVPGQRTGRIFQIQKTGDATQNITSNFISVDHNYAETYELTPVAGRFFRAEDHHFDFSAVDKVVVSEASIDLLGYVSAENAIGERIDFGGRSWQIIGVLPDYHQQSLHHSVASLFFIPSYGTMHPLSLRVHPQNIDRTIAQVQTLYADFFPNNDFSYQFLNERFQSLYESDLRFGNILSLFTILTIFIACLGLFGLASYTTFLRTKEIGVRKVLGASTFNLVTLLSKDFMLLVGMALVFAIPIAYYFMHQWLQSFAYRTEMQWWIFGLAGLAAMVIAFLTVSTQSLKAAMMSPVKSLKSE